MNIYYTAKDMEDLAAKGVSQLEIGPNVFLTDFAYETAEQLEIQLIQLDDQVTPAPSRRATPSPAPKRYNKPSGCQHGPTQRSSEVAPESNSQNLGSQRQSNDGTVNRLVDIMDKIIKRGD